MRTVILTGGSGFIGTNYVEYLATLPDVRVLNLDIAPPQQQEHKPHWIRCDIMEAARLKEIVRQAHPTELIHLAARTDMEGKTVEDYAANTHGTSNVVQAINSCSSIRRAIVTSSQYVVGPGRLPEHDEDFRPHTVYGQSKAISEQIVRNAGLSCCWTVVRPTNIWGIWHPRYPKEFWRVLKAGRYLHPGRKPVIRCYGYVKTVIQQMETILALTPEKVNRRVFYLGDPSINLLEWVNAFSRELRSRPVRIVPRALVRGVALVGDVINACGGRFPLFSSRYRSMTEDYDTPMQNTFAVLGTPNIGLEEGVRETVDWLRSQHGSQY